MKRPQKAWAALLCLCMAVTLMPGTVLALEGAADSYWEHIPKNKTFAFVDSRYYDGTDYVKVFNVGFYMGHEGQYYTNGDWTDMSKVYKREDYYKNEEFTHFSNTGKVGEPKPDGYPTNDVGGDADGKLASYNAGIYTALAWTNFEMYGRYWFNNYGIDSVINVPSAATYVEIWKVMPELTLSIDKKEVDRGDTFTLTLTIDNHFNNMEGLPAADEVIFSLDNAAATSDVAKADNAYTQTFQATEDSTVRSVNIKAGVLGTATNYKEKYETMTLTFDETYRVFYEFVSDHKEKDIPKEVAQLLPQDEKLYKNDTIVTAVLPVMTEVKASDGVWKFSGYDASSKTINANTTFIGTWTFIQTTPRPASDVPKTGDSGNPALWAALLLLASGGMTGIALYGGKRKAD